MMRQASCITVLCALIAGCATPPAPDVLPQPVEAAPPAPVVRKPDTAAIEQAHFEKAQTYMRERRWADALVQWEVLVLLNPSAQNYRDEMQALRLSIRSMVAGILSAAESARRRGNLNQATVEYLRVLNVDRDNAVAAQALREIESEQVRRQFLNRPPRVVM